MAFNFEQSLLKPEGRVLSTLERDGSRRWIYPRLSRGRFWQARRLVAYLLIAIFTLIPYTTIKHKPAMLLDIVHRKFVLFGYTFLPTDTILLALLLVSCVLSIFFFTAMLGRVWCGWACPQTVYMEFLYRPFERLFTGRGGAGGKPAGPVAGWRYALMYATFLLVSCYLAHTFLAYFVGVEQLRVWVRQSPSEHPASFLVMLITTGLMMFNFSVFREQTCIIACPYGRLQGVLMDRQSLIISYDAKRGEPRGKKSGQSTVGSGQSMPLTVLRTGPSDASSLPTAHGPPLTSALASTTPGDCVDCDLCAAVCPTGIDIRDGLQIECIGCAQCIDVCNGVMDKVSRPRGLIRYSSQSAMSGDRVRILRPRVIIYSGIVVGLLSLLATLLVTKAATDVTWLRGLGRPFVLTDAGEVENTLRLNLTNRSDEAQRLHIEVVDCPGVRAVATQDPIVVPPGQTLMEPVRVLAAQSMFKAGTLDVKLRITGEGPGGVRSDRTCRLLGPMAVSSAPAGDADGK